jgi:hypothetical protein
MTSDKCNERGCRPLSRGLLNLIARAPGADAPGFTMSPAPPVGENVSQMLLKTRSYGFALQKIAYKKSIGGGCRLGYGDGNLAVSRD